MYANPPNNKDTLQRTVAVFTQSIRTNQQWLDELPGKCSFEGQQHAHTDLARYLHKVAISYLHMRRDGVPLLSVLTQEELAQFAQDFVQEALEKLSRNNFALLAKFSGRGGFLSWMTQILRNDIASELRLSSWKTRLSQPCEDALAHFAARMPSPEQEAMIGHISEVLCAALAQLPDRYRTVFWERVVEGRPAIEVGARMGISANAVNVLVYRSKVKLRQYLADAGVNEEVLEVFSW